MPEVFDRQEDEYRAWLRGHRDGYVINVLRSRSGECLLHRATCDTIMTGGRYTTRDYIKVCDDSDSALRRWASSTEGAKERSRPCETCNP